MNTATWSNDRSVSKTAAASRPGGTTADWGGQRTLACRQVRDKKNLHGGVVMSAAAKVQPILVKRYARSRLYDTQSQSYVSVEQLRGWAAKNVAFLGRVDGFNQQ
jgi:hypothetical protein